MNNYARWVSDILLIDRKKSGATAYQRQIVSIEDISKQEWGSLGCVVTMTDRHHHSMADDVFNYNEKISVINF